jgi:hypothetical protein
MHALLRQKLLRDLVRQIPTEVLMHELVQRTIANKDMGASPLSLLQLVCAMASVRSARQQFAFAEALREAADELENPERVHVQ